MVEWRYGPYSSCGPLSSRRSVRKGLQSLNSISFSTIEYIFDSIVKYLEGSCGFTVRTVRTVRKVLDRSVNSMSLSTHIFLASIVKYL